MIQVQNGPDRLPRRPKRRHAVRDAHESLTLDLWVYATPSCLVADSATGGNASRHRERQVPFLRALATAPGSGANWKCAGRGRLAIACPIWAAPHGLTFGAYPCARRAVCSPKEALARPSSAARCQRERGYQFGKAIIALTAVYGLTAAALEGVRGSARRSVDRFAKILWRLIAGGGALRTGSPGVALLGWRRGPVDRAAGNCPGPGSKNFKVFRAFDPPL